MIEKIQLDNDDHYDGGNTKEYIVVHGTGNWNDTDEGNADYFCSGTRNSSAHRFVDDDSCTIVVDDDDCSWAVGDGRNAYGINNRNSLNIEMCCTNGQYSEATQENCRTEIKRWMELYNIPLTKVVRHYDASRKNCPSAFSANNWAKWYEFKNKLGGTYAATYHWLKINDKWYYYRNGVMLKGQWVKDSVDWCYLGSDGAAVANKWVPNSTGDWFFIGPDYHIMKNKWVKDSVDWCHLGADGSMDVNKWVMDSSGNWFWCGENGSIYRNRKTPDGSTVNAAGERI